MVIPSQTTKRTQNQSNHSRLLIQLTDKTTRKGYLSRKYELGNSLLTSPLGALSWLLLLLTLSTIATLDEDSLAASNPTT